MSQEETFAGAMGDSTFTLAALAAMETDEIKTLMSRLPDEGIYIVRGIEVGAGQNPPKDDQPPLFYFGYQHEILQAMPLDKEKDPESYVGKNLRERATLWTKDFHETIGLLKGRYAKIGLPTEGKLGGVEGQEPGWVDGIVGHIFQVRVRHFNSKNNGQEQAVFDWLPYERESEEEQAA